MPPSLIVLGHSSSCPGQVDLSASLVRHVDPEVCLSFYMILKRVPSWNVREVSRPVGSVVGPRPGYVRDQWKHSTTRYARASAYADTDI